MKKDNIAISESGIYNYKINIRLTGHIRKLPRLPGTIKNETELMNANL